MKSFEVVQQVLIDFFAPQENDLVSVEEEDLELVTTAIVDALRKEKLLNEKNV